MSMAVPAEDRAPAWLAEYGGSIEADITRMEEFAAALDAEVKNRYIPHMQLVQEDMLVELPAPLDSFPELYTFLQTHQVAQQSTSDIVYTVADATGGFAYAAQKVSAAYGEADAFAAAQAREIEAALDETKAARPPAGEN
jgi:hypothetical protein